jgi:hypothetical protein
MVFAAIAWVAGTVVVAQAGNPRADSRPTAAPAHSGGWWDDVFMERSTRLGAILAEPEAWRGVPATFVVQFREPAKADRAFFTKFEPDQWIAFAAWADEAPLWVKKDYDEDFRHLFVRRHGPEAKAIAMAARYDRFVVSGVVREVLKGRPWIEVTSLRRLPEKITEGSLVRLVKGLMLRDHRRFEAAAREFAAADGDTLPLAVRLVGMREHAVALLNAKDTVAAEERMLAALALDPANPETAEALAMLRERAKQMPRPASRPAVTPPAGAPAADEGAEEPFVPGPPDPLADRPRRTSKKPAGGPPQPKPGNGDRR